MTNYQNHRKSSVPVFQERIKWENSQKRLDYRVIPVKIVKEVSFMSFLSFWVGGLVSPFSIPFLHHCKLKQNQVNNWSQFLDHPDITSMCELIHRQFHDQIAILVVKVYRHVHDKFQRWKQRKRLPRSSISSFQVVKENQFKYLLRTCPSRHRWGGHVERKQRIVLVCLMYIDNRKCSTSESVCCA